MMSVGVEELRVHGLGVWGFRALGPHLASEPTSL